jgi:hypothetical protein
MQVPFDCAQGRLSNSAAEAAAPVGMIKMGRFIPPFSPTAGEKDGAPNVLIYCLVSSGWVVFSKNSFCSFRACWSAFTPLMASAIWLDQVF